MIIYDDVFDSVIQFNFASSASNHTEAGIDSSNTRKKLSMIPTRSHLYNPPGRARIACYMKRGQFSLSTCVKWQLWQARLQMHQLVLRHCNQKGALSYGGREVPSNKARPVLAHGKHVLSVQIPVIKVHGLECGNESLAMLGQKRMYPILTLSDADAVDNENGPNAELR